MPNDSWNLLEAMLQRRAWGVETSTAQMEIIGRRHYGRKAVPAGGGGGRGPTRELLDTLLLWNPSVVLDANGQAVVDGAAQRRADHLPDRRRGRRGHRPVRHRPDQHPRHAGPADHQRPAAAGARGRPVPRQLTLRNTTAKAMKVRATPRARPTLPAAGGAPSWCAPIACRRRTWSLAAGARQGAGLAGQRAGRGASCGRSRRRTRCGGARDALKARQRIVAGGAADGAAGHAGAGRRPLHA